MKTGGHIKPCKVGDVEAHNERDLEYMERMAKSRHPLHVYPELASSSNQAWKNSDREQYRDKQTGRILKVAQVFDQMIESYKAHDKRGRRPPLKDRERFDKRTGKMKTIAGWSPIREMVVVIKPDTKLSDFDKVKTWFMNHRVSPMFLHLHFDEGHLDDAGNFIANNHAHMGLDFFDWDTGKTVKLGPEKMKELQTVLADALGMERGEIKELTGTEHRDVVEQRFVAQAKAQADQIVADAQEEANRIRPGTVLKGAADIVAGLVGLSGKDKTIKLQAEEIERLKAANKALQQLNAIQKADYTSLREKTAQREESAIQKALKRIVAATGLKPFALQTDAKPTVSTFIDAIKDLMNDYRTMYRSWEKSDKEVQQLKRQLDSQEQSRGLKI